MESGQMYIHVHMYILYNYLLALRTIHLARLLSPEEATISRGETE